MVQPTNRTARIDIRLTIDDPVLIQQFRAYMEREWGNTKGAPELVLRKALREFLQRAEAPISRSDITMEPK